MTRRDEVFFIVGVVVGAIGMACLWVLPARDAVPIADKISPSICHGECMNAKPTTPPTIECDKFSSPPCRYVR